MIILATYNIRGGVGKTATAVNLAWMAARHGKSTLVWDLDPQGAATFYFRIKAKIKGGGKGLLRTEIPYASVVERMGVYRDPFGSYAGSSRAALAYAALWQEVHSRLEKD